MKQGNKIKNDLLKQHREALEAIQAQITYLENGFANDYEIAVNGPILAREKIEAGTRIMESLHPIEVGLTSAALSKYPFAVIVRQLSAQRYYSAQQVAYLLGKTKMTILREYVYNIYDENLQEKDIENKIAAIVLGDSNRSPYAIFADSVEAYARRNNITLRDLSEAKIDED